VLKAWEALEFSADPRCDFMAKRPWGLSQALPSDVGEAVKTAFLEEVRLRLKRRRSSYDRVPQVFVEKEGTAAVLEERGASAKDWGTYVLSLEAGDGTGRMPLPCPIGSGASGPKGSAKRTRRRPIYMDLVLKRFPIRFTCGDNDAPAALLAHLDEAKELWALVLSGPPANASPDAKVDIWCEAFHSSEASKMQEPRTVLIEDTEPGEGDVQDVRSDRDARRQGRRSTTLWSAYYKVEN
jgi:hypothetical protein